MSRQSYDPVAKAVQQFVVLPIILLLGIYLTGSFVEALFGISAAATRIFVGIGGIGFLVYYYRDWIVKILMR